MGGPLNGVTETMARGRPARTLHPDKGDACGWYEYAARDLSTRDLVYVWRPCSRRCV